MTVGENKKKQSSASMLSAVSAAICSFTQGGHKPGKPGILRDFSDHGKLKEFCATSGKIVTNEVF